MNTKAFFFSVVVWILSVFATWAVACTNIIVGKGASVDGSVMVSYNADSYGMFGNIYHHTGGRHLAGEMRKVYDWDTNKYLGEIPQAAVTYTVNAQMNEKQVSIAETTFGGREELWKTEGMIDYGSLIYIALERATSAREAIEVMTSLVERYGYCSEGESFSICDKQEAWILEMIGKGAGEKGAVWAAVRIPDDCVSAHANQSRITRLSQYGKKQLMCSKDVIAFARKKGYFTGKDADFSFRDAYAPNDFGAVRYCEARVWSIFNRFCVGMEQYVEYARGNDLKGEMPLYMKPKQKISVKDVMNAMRDHYEDTPFDIRNEVGAGAYNMPYRPTPLEWESEGRTYFNERPVSTQQTAFSFVGQMRAQYPDAIGGVAWVTNDDPNMAPYVPLYCAITEVPKCFRRIEGVQDDVTFSWESAFWVQNAVSNMVYPYYEKMFPDVLKEREKMEEMVAGEPLFAQEMLTFLHSEGEEALTKHLTDAATIQANMMLAAWVHLYEYLMVKHLDMAVKKVDADDPLLQKFKKTENGLAEPPTRPGYPASFRKKIAEEEGERYLMKN
ncbi:MAG: C69 family dipeptidase [Bacteroidaceae bacterium]|nr:C69 family dipeptidase [Bacteroidaceae bacterium]